MTTTIKLINLFESVFTTSFKHTASMLYNVTFETSNVAITHKKVIELENNFTNGISTGKHVGLQITLGDITIVKESLNSLILTYELINEIQSIPSRLKLHEMTKELREYEENITVKDLAKEVVSEILQPVKPEKKLTKKERLSEEATKKSLERQMEMIKKLSK
jgi:hypothetical protein